ncbi:MAG: ribonuclease HII [Candidatus Tectimicrobiota bacterium]
MARRGAEQYCFEAYEHEARSQGFLWIAGLDEVGRGPLAGPVVAGAVVLPVESHIPGLRDSKRLTALQRDKVYQHIVREAVTYGVGIISHTQIDQHNILWATKAAMLAALQQLQCVPDLLLIDGVASLPIERPQRLVVRGDARCASIAAASVVAKVTRDRLMQGYAAEYPLYGFDQHKGYPTPEHYRRLRLYGPCLIHRRSFRGVVPEHASGRGR